MTTVAFTVPGEPVGKARARVTTKGAYTPAKTATYEALIAWHAKVAMQAAGLKPISGPVRLKLVAVLGLPRSWSKKRTTAVLESPEAMHTGRPDLSNIMKAAEDALIGIVYADDSQISVLVASKRYGAEPRIEIEVRPA